MSRYGLSTNSKNKAFTLLELIIVIIIVGILATVGLSQYTKTVERIRMGEAKANIGYMRKLINEYYLKNGAMTGITNTDLGIGAAVPSSCKTTHYFRYYFNGPAGTMVEPVAARCTSGGKSPNYECIYYPYLQVDPVNGDSVWRIDKTSGPCPSAPSA